MIPRSPAGHPPAPRLEACSAAAVATAQTARQSARTPKPCRFSRIRLQEITLRPIRESRLWVQTLGRALEIQPDREDTKTKLAELDGRAEQPALQISNIPSDAAAQKSFRVVPLDGRNEQDRDRTPMPLMLSYSR